MIKRYTDHSANERTYLAWVRTAIAVMAFGFLMEKFNLFLTYLSASLNEPDRFQTSIAAEWVGLALFAVGIVLIISATVRFFLFKRAIEADDPVPYDLKLTNLLMSGLLVALAVFLMVYLGDQL
ncbi:YidH family protein [Saccharospirillum salsuginis]|uniref:Membrane protein n=1 Tax=Saccharospirillum salsuginis TaxID=418750 RepID=A0A918K1V7_9GAMM|nr:DUF202 domain-containing protein [Saccharospirillum salsuginis]GGX43526.1 membrane protein [Saccharospirillum salsuginis]